MSYVPHKFFLQKNLIAPLYDSFNVQLRSLKMFALDFRKSSAVRIRKTFFECSKKSNSILKILDEEEKLLKY